MKNFGYDLLLTIISAVLGAFLGVIIPKLLKDDKRDSEVCVSKELFLTQIHLTQNHYSTMPRKNSQPSANGQGGSGVEILVIYGIGSLFLIYAFLKFEFQISRAILIMTVLLESVCLTAAYMVIKKHHIDKAIKSILIFNAFATVCVPVLLYFMKNPIKNAFIDKKEILSTITDAGVLSLLRDANAYSFLLYQAIGIIVLLGFMLFTMIGTVHVLSMVNLALGSRGPKFWKWLYKKTVGFCNSAGVYISLGIFLLVFSFLLVSGILASVLKWK